MLGLPTPSLVTIPVTINTEALNSIGMEMYFNLNYEQKDAINMILDSIRGLGSQKLFFLEAPGGCGKTYVYSCLLNIVRGRGRIALAAAWTGIAALLLDDGKTIHKTFGLPVPITETSVSYINTNSEQASILRDSTVIVIDEASMIPGLALYCIDRLLRDITQLQEPFGGKIIVFGGDFRQVLPVVPHSGKVKTIEACLKYSRLWRHIYYLHLTQNMRTNSDEVEFADWLLTLGNGELSSEIGEGYVNISADFISTNSLIDHVFGSNINTSDISAYSSKAIVCPLNDDCVKINNEVLDIIIGDIISYYSVDSIIVEDESDRLNIPLEYLNSLTPSGMPPHELKLKKGAIVILIRNMNIGCGLVNGVRMVVLEMLSNCLKLEIITGKAKGNLIFLPRIDLISTDVNMPFVLRRRQFPIRLAFAITINKSQGQTFDKIGIFLSRCVFSHGQLYVAFSRARAASDVKIFINQTNEQGQFQNHHGYFTKNVVYREVLA